MRALIVDDEFHCQNVIEKLVKEYCPDITSTQQADDVASALSKIKTFKPEIVFLDIQLHDQTSFDLLDQLDEINFQIIFTTAYDNYAIKAFDYSALHYLLKPISPSDLMEAVKRCANNELKYEKKIIEKTKGFYLNTHENSYDIIYDQIMYIKADGSYSTIHNENGKKIFTSKRLGEYKDMLSDNFYRIHNSIIVNMNFVLKLDKQGINVILKDENTLPISRRKKSEFKKKFSVFSD